MQLFKNALALVCLTACGGSNASPGADAAISTDARVHSTFASKVDDNRTGAPIAGAQICTTPTDGAMPCVTTAADGTYAYTLMLPDAPTKLAKTTTATGYLGREELMFEMPSIDLFWEDYGGLYSTADATSYLAGQAGFAYPSSTTGFVRMYVAQGTQLIPATATISPESGSGPVYYDAAGPNPTLSDTSQGSLLLFGNLAPGTYAVTVQSAGRTCTVLESPGTINGEWPPVDNETLSVAVSADAMTVGLSVDCH
jgi:hypothetical protein